LTRRGINRCRVSVSGSFRITALHLLAGADDATVEVIFRHRPLSGIRGHETGETAVQLSEIAANRGEFWQFLEKLYREPYQLDHDGYLRFMRDLGFQSSQIEAILADADHTGAARYCAGRAPRCSFDGSPKHEISVALRP
jgi:hypothetical protein